MHIKKVVLSQESKDKILNGEITIVAGTEKLARQIADSEKDGVYSEGKGMRFIFPYKNSTVGIDNSTGNAWTEEFADYETCLAWLCGQFEISDLANEVDENLGDVINAVKQDWEDTKDDFRNLKNAPKKALHDIKNSVLDAVSGKKFNVKYLRKLLKKVCKNESDTVRVGSADSEDDVWYFIVGDEPRIKVYGVGDKQKIRSVNPKGLNYSSGIGKVKQAQKAQKKKKFKAKKKKKQPVIKTT